MQNISQYSKLNKTMDSFSELIEDSQSELREDRVSSDLMLNDS